MKDQTEILGAKISVVSLDDIKFDPHNANKHTPEGKALLKQSMTERGFGRPTFSAADLTMLGGNHALEVARETGHKEAIIIETDGSLPIIHVRTDLDSSNADARTLAIEDNRIAQVSLNWDDAALLEAKEVGVNMMSLFGKMATLGVTRSLVSGEDADSEEGVAQMEKAIQSSRSITPTSDLVDYVNFGRTNIPISPDEVSGLSELYERYVSAVGVHAGFFMWLLQDWGSE